jgi:hypothetical protein
VPLAPQLSGLLLLRPQAPAPLLLVAVACPSQAGALAPHLVVLLGLLLLLLPLLLPLLRVLLLRVGHEVPRQALQGALPAGLQAPPGVVAAPQLLAARTQLARRRVRVPAQGWGLLPHH